jgi:hypothetical protein
MKRKLTTLAIFGMLFALAIANAMASNVWLHAPYTGSGWTPIGRDDRTEKKIRLIRAVDTEKQRRIKVERQARTLRIAALRLHLKAAPLAALHHCRQRNACEPGLPAWEHERRGRRALRRRRPRGRKWVSPQPLYNGARARSYPPRRLPVVIRTLTRAAYRYDRFGNRGQSSGVPTGFNHGRWISPLAARSCAPGCGCALDAGEQFGLGWARVSALDNRALW